METSKHRPRVVIIGAGFGGLTLARALRKVPVEVLLIDRRNYHTFQPLLYQVATAGLEPEEIAHTVRGIFHGVENFHFRIGTAADVDWAEQAVVLADGARLSYDYLVLAAGATNNFFGVEGAEAYSYPLKSLEEAVQLRSHIIRQFEAVDQVPARFDEGLLNFVIVGGGPTGVEMAGALAELFRLVLRSDYPTLPVDRARVVLVEASDHVLGAYHPESQRYAEEKLRRFGIEVRLSEQVVRVEPDRVHLSSGDVIPTHTLIWAAGIQAEALADTLGLVQTKGGRLVVEPDLSVPGHPNVFAIGDVAGSRDAEGLLHPQVAPLAMQGAEYVAGAIQRRMAEQEGPAFAYRDKGTMSTIGRHAAVAELAFGVRMKGFLAWGAWLGLHLVQLIGFRNRLNVLVNWAWNYFTYDRSARLIMDVEPMAPAERLIGDGQPDGAEGKGSSIAAGRVPQGAKRA